ncbi:MAG: copper resistance protein NlpE [Burkholderiaceae bacterium]|nr:copper resistance protein NlpE [Burkholderiaceae bacterium]
MRKLVGRSRVAGVFALCLAVSACAASPPGRSQGGAASGPTTDSRATPHPGARSYAGTYSCEGCLQRAITVTVFPDGSYRLREVPGRGEPVIEQGRWHASPQAPDRLVLEARGSERVLRREAPDALILVDPEGRELRGLVGGVLTRLPTVDPIPDSRLLVGVYRMRDGQRVLVDCASGATLWLAAGAPGSAQAALDAAWHELAPRDDETVLVAVHAHEVEPDGGASAGAALRTDADAAPAIVVDAFERATRNGRCPLSPASR